MKRNKGYTLFEMLVSVAVLAIVMAQVVQFIGESSRIYSHATFESSLQTEASQVILQIEDLMVDATFSVSSTEDPVTHSDIIQIVNISPTDSTKYITYTIKLEKEEEDDPYGTVYYQKTDEDGNLGMKMPISDYVASLNLDTSSYSVNDRVTLVLAMQGEKYTYSAVKDVFLRNRPGTHKNSIPSGVSGGNGDGTLHFLRYHEYSYADIVPLAYQGITPTWKDTDGSMYFNAGSSSISGADVNSNSSQIGPYVLEFKKSETDIYRLSVIADPIVVPAYDSNLIYANGDTTSITMTSYIPIQGIDVTKATNIKTTVYWVDSSGNMTLLAGGTSQDVPTFSYSEGGDNIVQVDSGITVDTEFMSNCFVYTMDKINPSHPDYYVDYMTDEHKILMVETTCKIGGDTYTVHGYIYPMKEGLYDEDERNEFMSIASLDSESMNHSNDQNLPRFTVTKDVHYDLTDYTGTMEVTIKNTGGDTPMDWHTSFQLDYKLNGFTSYDVTAEPEDFDKTGLTMDTDGKTVTIAGLNEKCPMNSGDSFSFTAEFKLLDPAFTVTPGEYESNHWGSGKDTYKFEFNAVGSKGIELIFTEDVEILNPNGLSISGSGKTWSGTTEGWGDSFTAYVFVHFTDGSPSNMKVRIAE